MMITLSLTPNSYPPGEEDCVDYPEDCIAVLLGSENK